MQDDLFKAFLELGGLSEQVKTEADKEFAMDYIKKKVGLEKVRRFFPICLSVALT